VQRRTAMIGCKAMPFFPVVTHLDRWTFSHHITGPPPQNIPGLSYYFHCKYFFLFLWLHNLNTKYGFR
jgi:hypothetical protein